MNLNLQGAILYIFIMAYWVYYSICLIYLILTKGIKNKSKYLLSFLLMIIGYLMYRGGDIIDGDFIKRFQPGPLVGFLLSSIVLVLIDNNIGKSESRID